MKLSKKVTSAVLAAVLSMSMVVSAFAADAATSKTTADTPVDAKAAQVDSADKSSVEAVDTTEDGEATVAKVENKKTVTIAANVTVGGVKYAVTTIKANAFKGADKVKTVKVTSKKIAFKKNATKGAKNLKTIKLSKITKASQVSFAKNCFKGSKVKTIQVSKKMKKAQLNKLKAALKKAGYKNVKVKANL